MALFYHGHKLTDLADHGKTIDTLYRHGHKIYSHKFSDGAVLWQGPAAFVDDFKHVTADGRVEVVQDPRVLINQNITLPKSIKYLKSGLTINIDPTQQVIGGSFNYIGENTMSTSTLESLGAKIVNTHVTLAQLQNRTAVAIVEETTWTVYCQAVDDTHIKFYAVNASGSITFETEQNSTQIDQFDSSGNVITWYARYLVLIQSITAY